MKKGFTLIELLVVVAIIGIMMAGAIANVGAGRDAARAREASRGVAQMVHYANALALLRQRPVVLTYIPQQDGNDIPTMRIEVKMSGESMAAASDASPAEPIYREVDGMDTSAAGVDAAKAEEDGAGGGDVVERTGFFFTRKILDPDELAKEDAEREFEGMAIEVEHLADDGLQVDEATARSLNDQATGLLNNRVTASIKAWSNTSGEIDVDRKKSDKDEEDDKKKAESEPVHVIFETNGYCQPHRVTLRASGQDGKDDGVVITVSRSAKVTIGDEEERK